jgi:hypothetical protein
MVGRFDFFLNFYEKNLLTSIRFHGIIVGHSLVLLVLCAAFILAKDLG